MDWPCTPYLGFSSARSRSSTPFRGSTEDPKPTRVSAWRDYTPRTPRTIGYPLHAGTTYLQGIITRTMIISGTFMLTTYFATFMGIWSHSFHWCLKKVFMREVIWTVVKIPRHYYVHHSFLAGLCLSYYVVHVPLPPNPQTMSFLWPWIHLQHQRDLKQQVFRQSSFACIVHPTNQTGSHAR